MTAPRTRLAIAAVACALTLGGLAGCGKDDTKADDTSPADGSPTATTATSDPGDTATSSPNESSTTPEDAVTVPLYFAGDTPQGPRLFREFRAVPADNPLEEASALVTGGDVLDPDYGTLWAGGGFDSVTFSEGAGAFIVQLVDNSLASRPGDMTAKEAELALQQVVYTLQGVQQTRAPVLFQIGADPATVFGIDTTPGITDAPQLDVLAQVNVTAPEEGASVSDTFTASGVASSFEANVPWEIRQGDEVVKTGFSTAEGWMDKLYPWETEVDVSDLPAGDYTFVALTDDPSDGEGGGPTEDSKTITVG